MSQVPFVIKFRSVQLVSLWIVDGATCQHGHQRRDRKAEHLDLEMTIFSSPETYKIGPWVIIALFYCNTF